MSTDVTRRNFLKGAAVGAVGVAATSMLGSCSSEKDESAAVPEETRAADITDSCDLVVVGCGGFAGAIAAAHASDLGKKVIALDRALGFNYVNFRETAGVGSFDPNGVIQEGVICDFEKVFAKIFAGTGYEINCKMLRNLMEYSVPALQILLDTGVPMFNTTMQVGTDDPSAFTQGSIFTVYGADRVPYLDSIFESRASLDVRWGSNVRKLLTNDAGAVCGVRYIDKDDQIVEITSDAVIVGTGGFANNPEMFAKYFGGSEMVAPGNIYNDGAGIQMCQDAGAQIGKNFAISMNESGGCNVKSTPVHARRAAGPNAAPALVMPLLGGLLVNRIGERYMPESTAAEGTMWCAEPMLREGRYYAVIDQGVVDNLMVTPILEVVSEAAKAMGPNVSAAFQGVTLTKLQDHLNTGIADGWIWKADSFEGLAEQIGMSELVETCERYNGYCRHGLDTQFYKKANYLYEVKQPPYYLIEYQVSAWLTMGGIKTDAFARALNADEQVIPGLFVVGADGDFFSCPYFLGGSASGFSISSGYLAAEAANGTFVRV